MSRRTAVGWDQVDAQATPTYATVTFGHAYNNGTSAATRPRRQQLVALPGGLGQESSYTANTMNQYRGGRRLAYIRLDGQLDRGRHRLYPGLRRREPDVSGGTGHHRYARRAGPAQGEDVGDHQFFVTDADNRELLEYDGSNGHVLRRYVYGNGIDEALNQVDVSNTFGSRPRVTLIPDIQGSMIGSLSSGGAAGDQDGVQVVRRERQHDRVLPLHGPPHRCRDERVYYYCARAYSPSLGRLLFSPTQLDTRVGRIYTHMSGMIRSMRRIPWDCGKLWSEGAGELEA